MRLTTAGADVRMPTRAWSRAQSNWPSHDSP